VVKAPHRKSPEVDKHYEHIHQIRHLAQHHGPQGEDDQKTNHQRYPGELAEVTFEQWAHSNVVIE
jgi:hypothetical protein